MRLGATMVGEVEHRNQTSFMAWRCVWLVDAITIGDNNKICEKSAKHFKTLVSFVGRRGKEEATLRDNVKYVSVTSSRCREFLAEQK